MTHYLAEHARFDSVREMDNAVHEQISLHRQDLNKTDLAVLDMIRRYSVKYLAAHLKQETIEKAVGKSNATVRRALRKLEKLGIIEKAATIRPVLSGSGANIYIILPADDQGEMTTRGPQEKPHGDGAGEVYSKTEPFSFQSKTHKVLTDTSPVDESRLSTSLFTKMKSLLSGMLGCDKLAREFYGAYLSVSKTFMFAHVYEGDADFFEEPAYRALVITLLASKKKPIQRLQGYYSGVLRKLLFARHGEVMFGIVD